MLLGLRRLTGTRQRSKAIIKSFRCHMQCGTYILSHVNTALPAAACTPRVINSRVSCLSHSQAEAERSRQDKSRWDPGGILPDYITKEDELWQGCYVRNCAHDEHFLLYVCKIPCFSKSPLSGALVPYSLWSISHHYQSWEISWAPLLQWCVTE